jgi:hypothetical protein
MTTDKPTDALLPCPFCGTIEHLFIEPDEVGSGGQWVSPIHVGCAQYTGCGVSVTGETEAEAIAAWNTRPQSAAPSPDADLVERPCVRCGHNAVHCSCAERALVGRVAQIIRKSREINCSWHDAARLARSVLEASHHADLVEALKTTTVHLIAAISLLEKLHNDLPQSKKHALFNTKLSDYSKAFEVGRALLTKLGDAS